MRLRPEVNSQRFDLVVASVCPLWLLSACSQRRGQSQAKTKRPDHVFCDEPCRKYRREQPISQRATFRRSPKTLVGYGN
jgi:hypothetical protein